MENKEEIENAAWNKESSMATKPELKRIYSDEELKEELLNRAMNKVSSQGEAKPACIHEWHIHSQRDTAFYVELTVCCNKCGAAKIERKWKYHLPKKKQEKYESEEDNA